MKKMLITGHRGLLGSACVRHFQKKYEIITPNFDLRNEKAVDLLFSEQGPDFVVHCAAKVGGVKANRDFPVDFMLDNVRMQSNVIESAATYGVDKLIFIATSCLFPKDAATPVCEESLMTGRFEPSVEAYSIAKLAGWRLCKAYYEQYGRNFLTVCPSNIYGPNDNYGPTAHVIPALMNRILDAKNSGGDLVVWGDGSAIREFIHADDAASAIGTVLEDWHSPEVINIGTGVGTSIRELVETLVLVSGFQGDVIWDTNQPSGIPRKTFNISKLNEMGWFPQIEFSEGLRRTWEEFSKNTQPRGKS